MTENATAPVALTLSDVNLAFPDGDSTITALDHISLQVGAGEIAAITGPSGSGKSTLLSVAGALKRPDSGSVLLRTEPGAEPIDLARLSRGQASAVRREHIGIVFQQSNLVSSLSAVEQLEAMSHLGQRVFTSRAAKARTRERAMDLLERVGLADDAHKRPGQLSGGQRQRVNLARALMNRPSLLVVDEPTSALDQQRGAEVIELIIGAARERQAATLLVTHDRTHLHRMDAVYRVVDGALSREDALVG